MFRSLLVGSLVAGIGGGVLAAVPTWTTTTGGPVLPAVFVLVVSALVVWLHARAVAAETLARTDTLTGAPNRRAFGEAAARAIRRMRRRKGTITVVYIDVDGFKRINDTLGHAMGDRVLCCVAGALRGALRRTDAFARVGGDEFVVLIEGNRPAPLLARLQKALRRATLAEGLDVRFSVGAVTFHDAPRSADELLRRGDRVMYEAKSEGDRLVHRVA